MKALSGQKIKSEMVVRIQGWLASLFEFESKPHAVECLYTAAGNRLIPLLGEELFKRLREVKESFKTSS